MNNLIKNSIEYYDSKYHNLIKKLKIEKNEQVIQKDNTGDIKENFFIIKDINNNNKFKSSYEILCKIDEINKIITWSWAIPSIKKNKMFISKNLLNYGLDLNDDNLIELKNILINSKIKYENKNSLDMLLIIFLFLTKKDAFLIINNCIYIFYDIEN
jgi:hypothetical protein